MVKSDIVHQILPRIPDWKDAQEIQITRIGGLTNENYRVTLEGSHFVLRVSGQNTDQLGIDRVNELESLKTAAAAGIGPDVVAFLLPEGHLVTRWVDGRHLEAGEFRTHRNVLLLTETVKHIHSLRPGKAIFSPFRRVVAYLKTVQDLGIELPAGFDAYLKTMQAVEKDQINDPWNWKRFCHNDLVSVNYLFIGSEQDIKVLDWEFAGLGDIYYDLATLVYTHDSDGPISTELEEVMLAAYFGEATTWQRRRLLGMKYMFMLFTGMWGLAQHAMQQAGLIQAVDGFDYLDFARYLFEKDIQELQNLYQESVNRDPGE
jgi:thiamine kinase-like enzyme